MQPNGACNRGEKTTRRRKKEGGRQVRTRERGRPSGQETRILNAVPGSAAEAEAEAEAGAAIQSSGAGGGATETGLAGARQRRSAAGWV